jgi:hypothetical protein
MVAFCHPQDRPPSPKLNQNWSWALSKNNFAGSDQLILGEILSKKSDKFCGLGERPA